VSAKYSFQRFSRQDLWIQYFARRAWVLGCRTDLRRGCVLSSRVGSFGQCEGSSGWIERTERNLFHLWGFVRVCVMEARDMRRMIVLAVMGLMLAGSAVASAQLIDPTTGVMVDPTTDPVDFAAVASGQPGNVGMELAAQATAQAQAFAAKAANGQ
jgi:hypothetical protein